MADQFGFDVNKFKMPQVPVRTAAGGLLVLAALVGVFGAVYQIEPEEVGVVLRFGEYNRTTDPGLNFKLPLLETLYRVPVQRQLSQEFGVRTGVGNARGDIPGQQRRVAEEAVMLTGDLNVAVVEWIVQYRVSDPRQYLFEVRNLEETFHDMTEAVMREAVGDRTVTEVVTIGRQDIESTVEARLQELTTQYRMGLTVDQVVLQDVNPPDPVRPSWDEVRPSSSGTGSSTKRSPSTTRSFLGLAGKPSRRFCKPRATRSTA